IHHQYHHFTGRGRWPINRSRCACVYTTLRSCNAVSSGRFPLKRASPVDLPSPRHSSLPSSEPCSTRLMHNAVLPCCALSSPAFSSSPCLASPLPSLPTCAQKPRTAPHWLALDSVALSLRFSPCDVASSISLPSPSLSALLVSLLCFCSPTAR